MEQLLRPLFYMDSWKMAIYTKGPGEMPFQPAYLNSILGYINQPIIAKNKTKVMVAYNVGG